MMARSPDQPRWTQAHVEYTATGIRVRAAGRTFTERHRGTEVETLARLAARALDEGVELRGCVDCIRFWAPPDPLNFPHPRFGYCSRVGRSRSQPLLRIDSGCGEHQGAPGWPGDLPLLDQSRAHLSELERTPDRSLAFEGALVGLAAGAIRLRSAPVGAGPDADIRTAIELGERLAPARGAEAERLATGAPAGAASAAVLGLRFAASPERLLRVAWARGGQAGEVLAASALLVALALQKRDAAGLSDALMETCAPRSPGLRVSLVHRSRAFGEVLSAKGAGSRWAAEKAVADALRCFARTPEGLEEAVSAAAEHPASPGEVARLTGALSGAYNGLDAVPEAWRDRLPELARLRQVGHALWLSVAAEGGVGSSA